MSVAGDINDTARAIKCIDKNADRLMCKIEVVSITISGSVDTSSKRKVPSPPPLSLSFSLIKKLNISCAWTGKLWNYASTDYGMRWWIYLFSSLYWIYLFISLFFLIESLKLIKNLERISRDMEDLNFISCI